MDGPSFSPDEQRFLKDLARTAILKRLNNTPTAEIPKPPAEFAGGRLGEPCGAFVTLKKSGRLRGCIGRMTGDDPLYETVWGMAQSAAFEDPRFPPLKREEFPELEFEISVLTPPSPCPDPNLVEIGRHGLVVRRGFRSGVFLPQVPVEWNWDLPTYLNRICEKAGLEPGCVGKPDVQLSWFEAFVF